MKNLLNTTDIDLLMELENQFYEEEIANSYDPDAAIFEKRETCWYC